jgi:hypothetical protein
MKVLAIKDFGSGWQSFFKKKESQTKLGKSPIKISKPLLITAEVIAI